jgi:hypothetical protein
MPARVPEELRDMKIDRGLDGELLKLAEDAACAAYFDRTHEIGVRLTLHE